MPTRRVAVLGAGPIGLETALAFLDRGDDVQVYERDAVGGNVKRWGHVRLFSPWEMNHSRRGARLLKEGGAALPEPGVYLTGAEHAERYLVPLARTPVLSSRVHEGVEVIAIGRDGIGKSDLIGGPREKHPFRILLQRAGGEEEISSADVVVDCTGTYGNPNRLGNGNVPARGERALSSGISYELRDVAGRERSRFERKSVLLAGGGHSAATALDALLRLSGTAVHWVVRGKEPLEVIANDPLPERKRLSELARRLSEGADPRVRFYPATTVEGVSESGAGFEVELGRGGRSVVVGVDEILAHVGYRPDNGIYRELQVHECYASLAPMRLAAALVGEKGADCLAQTSKGPETLVNPEPDFFILGAKSYGKNSNFLIRIGLAQIEELVSLLDARERKERIS